MSLWYSKRKKIDDLDTESDTFKASVFDWLFDRLASGVEASESNGSKIEHLNSYIETKNKLSKLSQKYQNVSDKINGNERIRIAGLWHEYWNLWFMTTLNTYSPSKLTEFAEKRNVLEKEILFIIS